MKKVQGEIVFVSFSVEETLYNSPGVKSEILFIPEKSKVPKEWQRIEFLKRFNTPKRYNRYLAYNT